MKGIVRVKTKIAEAKRGDPSRRQQQVADDGATLTIRHFVPEFPCLNFP